MSPCAANEPPKSGIKTQAMLSSDGILTLIIQGIGPVPAHKNRRVIRGLRPLPNKINLWVGVPILAIEKSVKKRYEQLEHAIELCLLSWYQTGGGETDMECQKQQRTRLSTLLKELTDDSLNQIPVGEFRVRYVEAGMDGVVIDIQKL